MGRLDPGLQPRGPKIMWTAAQTSGQWLRGLSLAGKWRLEQRGLSEDCWGPRATSLAGLGVPGIQGRRATISVLGGFWRGEGAWKLSGPQGQPSGSGGWCAGGWGEGQAGYCQELRTTSPGSGPSLSARGRPGARVVGPPDSSPSLFLTVSAPLIRAPAGMQGPSRESRVISPRDP